MYQLFTFVISWLTGSCGSHCPASKRILLNNHGILLNNHGIPLIAAWKKIKIQSIVSTKTYHFYTTILKKKDKIINQELSGLRLTFHVHYVVDVEENEDAGATSLPTQPLQPSSSTYDPSNMPSSGYTGIQIPPGAHAPANTPAEVPHSTGRKLKLNRFELFLS